MIFPDNKLLRIPMYLSSIVGIWPIIFTDNAKLKRMYTIISKILYYYYLGYILRAYYQLLLLLKAENTDLQEVLGNLCITLIYTVSMVRVIAFDTEGIKTLFQNIIDKEKEILEGSDEEAKRIYNNGVNLNRIYHIMFFVNGWVVSFLYFIHPFFMELPTMMVGNETITLKTLPLSTWWPIDVQKHYWIAYWWNVWEGTLGSSFVIHSDLLTFSLILYAVYQLDMLSYKIQRLKTNTSQNVFIELIQQHQVIIKYVDTFNVAMKYVLLVDFLQCSVQLATITLQLFIMKLNIQNVIFVGEFLITMVMRLVIYYTNGNELIVKSQKLAVDLWSTDWYLNDQKFKGLMKIFMIRAQRPLKFQIGPFGVLSLEALITILKATYSYMMLFINARK